MLPVYRKELRKVLLEYLKVVETQKDLKDTEGFDWLESIELASDKRKFLLNRLFVKQQVLQEDENESNLRRLSIEKDFLS